MPTANIDGITTRYELAGSGPPVAWIVLGVLVVLGAAGLAVLYLVRTGRLAFR